jgi:hypothetical protein
LLSNARELLAEQDDEIKKLNELILEAKVHAVRDAQVAEKAAIKQSHQEHDYRIDMMMEEERIRGLLETERIEHALKEEHLQGRVELEAQISERKMIHQLNAEIKEQEQKAMLDKLELLHLEDYEAAQQMRDEARVLMADVQRANEEAIRIREGREAATALEELKMAEFLEQKALREQELEEEGLRKKAVWEREQARMIESQDLANDLASERDELAERRAHAARERAARAAAIEKAAKSEAAKSELINGLDAQIVSHAHERARAAEADYKEFQLNIHALDDVIQSEAVKEDEAKDRRVANKEGVIEQIQEKERAAIKERVNFFHEGSELDVAARDRADRLQQIKDRKLADLAATGIHPAHIHQVKRAVQQNSRRAMKVSGPVV